ncbi:inositol monophosphatase [candidate division KSB1 bacterium]|nr:inositol monophosphatase [candidate division KSB1 bacterium]RQW07160.1 MAG: inositol monophosphatase [candidate division KSB1 bacterium]
MRYKSKFGQIAIRAAREAGSFLMEHFGKISHAEIEIKEKSDFVTKIDKESEQHIIKVIRDHFPDHKIYAEETIQQDAGGYRWMIDPLDGTTNYIHGVPVFSVSIGLEHNGTMVLGVVYDPTREELFYAEADGGAFLNEHAIRVSDIRNPERALLATGYPFRMKDYIDLYQESFKQLFAQVSGIRRAGSAAIDLCYIACGRYDGFWELGLHAWDIAASQIILQEAGGKITDFAGGDNVLQTGNTVASNTHLHPVILHIINKVFAGVIEK